MRIKYDFKTFLKKHFLNDKIIFINENLIKLCAINWLSRFQINSFFFLISSSNLLESHYQFTEFLRRHCSNKHSTCFSSSLARHTPRKLTLHHKTHTSLLTFSLFGFPFCLPKMGWLWQFLFIWLLFQAPFCTSSSISDLFDDWCRQHGRTYASDQEKQHRLRVFEDNYAYVLQHNGAGNSSYTLALNAFADLTHHEFKAAYLGLSASGNDGLIRLNRGSSSDSGSNVVGDSDVPASLDWREKGAVTEVKDQGSCGMSVLSDESLKLISLL